MFLTRGVPVCWGLVDAPLPAFLRRCVLVVPILLGMRVLRGVAEVVGGLVVIALLKLARLLILVVGTLYVAGVVAAGVGRGLGLRAAVARAQQSPEQRHVDDKFTDMAECYNREM